jgi:hypothetical protein
VTCSAEAAAAVALLRRPETIRARCHALLALAEADRLPHFALRAERLDAAADCVVDTIRERHPDGAIPYHARWRHFASGGRDRWGALSADLGGLGPAETARLRVELCVVSVLLDAGAGAAWLYTEPGTGAVLRRSEGLAVASLDAFRTGLFSGAPRGVRCGPTPTAFRASTRRHSAAPSRPDPTTRLKGWRAGRR